MGQDRLGAVSECSGAVEYGLVRWRALEAEPGDVQSAGDGLHLLGGEFL